MDLLTVCTRISIDSGVTCRSLAGLSIRAHNGFVHTFLLDNRDPNISIQIIGSGDRSQFLAVFHVFVGRYLETLTLKDIEIFRFHGESWPSFLADDDTPSLNGEIIHVAPGPVTTVRHSYEHLGGLYLTDAMHLSANMQAGAATHKLDTRYAPDADEYRRSSPFLPHPGLVRDDTEIMETILRYEDQHKSHRVM
jgi:hypothetical protein